MPTLDQMVDEAISTLSSYGLATPKMASLAADCTDTDTTLTLSTVASMAPGPAEIGQERMIVTQVNRDSSTVTVERGYLSVAAAHTAGEKFYINSPWPRVVVATYLNDAIVGAYPDLYAVAEEDFNSSTVVDTYDLDALTERVLRVRVLSIGPDGEWLEVRNYRFDAPLHKLTVYNYGLLNQPVKVVSQRRLQAIGLADDITVSGLNASAKQYVILMALAKLTANMDTAKLPNAAGAADTYSPYRTVGTATNVSQQLIRLAEFELQRERKRLIQANPPTMTMTRKGGFYHT